MSAARVREALGETPASVPSGNRGARGRVAWVAAGTEQDWRRGMLRPPSCSVPAASQANLVCGTGAGGSRRDSRFRAVGESWGAGARGPGSPQERAGLGGAECCAPRPARFQRRPRLTSGEAALRARLRRPRRAGTSIVAGAMVPEVPPTGNRGARGRAPWLPNGRLARSAALREGGGALDAACAGRLGGCQAVDGGGGSPSDGLPPPWGLGRPL